MDSRLVMADVTEAAVTAGGLGTMMVEYRIYRIRFESKTATVSWVRKKK